MGSFFTTSSAGCFSTRLLHHEDSLQNCGNDLLCFALLLRTILLFLVYYVLGFCIASYHLTSVVSIVLVLFLYLKKSRLKTWGQLPVPCPAFSLKKVYSFIFYLFLIKYTLPDMGRLPVSCLSLFRAMT
jgi:hypothetical protein